MKPAVVILNWNTEGFLRKFLPGLLHSVRNVEGAEVIVADNDSTDGSMELMHPISELPFISSKMFSKRVLKGEFSILWICL